MSGHQRSSENQPRRFHHWRKVVVVLLLVVLVTTVSTVLLAAPVYAAPKVTPHSLFTTVKEFTTRLLPERKTSASSPEGAVLGDTDTEDTDVASLERRLSTLENHLTLNVADSISLAPVALSATNTNLLRNSSFESAAGEHPRQWTYLYDSTSANSGQSKEGIRSGAHGIKFIGAISTGRGLNLGISQPETETVPNRTYTFSIYLKHTNITEGTSVRIGFWDKYNNRFGPMKTITLSAGNKDWYRITTTVTTTGSITDHANWYPMLEVRGLQDGAAVYMDDAQLEEGSLLTLYNSALAGGYSSSSALLGMGSVLGTTTGTLYPSDSGVGSLGKRSNKWDELYLSKATITKDGDLNLEGSATVGSNLTVNGEAHLKGALKLNAISYLFPSAQGAASSFLMNDGAGGLSWGTLGAASVTPNSLDFTQFVDAMTLDADTSINLYDGAARNLRFYNSNSGAEMLFLNGSTGNVGIGTTSPEVNLEIVKVIRPELRLNAGSTITGGSGPRVSFYAPNSPAALDNKNFAITTNIGNVSQSASEIGTIVNQFQILRIRDSGSFNAVLLSINPNGNTTIGPSGGAHEGEARLTLLGNALGESQLRLRSNRQGIAAGNTIGGIDFASNDTNLASPGGVTSSIKALAEATHTASVLDTGLAFSVTNGTTFSEAMRITSSGNVGIGTTAPESALDITGLVNVHNTSASGINLYTHSDTGFRAPQVNLYRSNGTQSDPLAVPNAYRLGYLNLGGYDGTTYAQSVEISSIATEAWTTTGHGSNLLFSAVPTGSTSSVTRMVIGGTGNVGIGSDLTPDYFFDVQGAMNVDGATYLASLSGNVGIGTTSPAYKLDVAGDINTTGDIRKNGTAYDNPDYVFEPDYNLMSLSDLKSYVSLNKHLPGVPSSEDVRRDGVKLFEQTRLNLEKTEEAYLYLFDLDDRVSELSLSLPTSTQPLVSVHSQHNTLALDDETATQFATMLGSVEQEPDGTLSFTVSVAGDKVLKIAE